MVSHKNDSDENDNTSHSLSQVPLILQEKNLKSVDHTPSSAKKLLENYGYFANEKDVLFDIERNLFDAFIDDDYEGQLHLSALHSITQPDEDEEPLGIAFWRLVPDDEMIEWIDWQHIGKALSNHKGNDSSNTMCKKKRMVRNNSVESIQKMVNSMHLPSDAVRDEDKGHVEMSHAWIKLELIAVRKRHCGHHLGSLLLACTLYNAHCKYDQSRVLLHIAGGEENIPALRLYNSFGFLKLRSGTAFHKPDRFLYVLGDIKYSLSHLLWKDDTVSHDEDTGINTS